MSKHSSQSSKEEQFFTNWIASLLAILLVGAAVMFFVISNTVVIVPRVEAQTISPLVARPYQDSPTTVPTTPHSKVYSGSTDVSEALCNDPLLGPSAIIHTSCASVALDAQKRDKDKAAIVVAAIDPIQVTIVDIPDLANDIADDATKAKTNNGNHYGNDKPDNNSHDCKNKHDTACGGG